MSGEIRHDHARRVDALREALDVEGLAGAVLSRPQHVFYFTGLMPGLHPALLAVLPQAEVAVAPSAVEGTETITYTTYDIQNGWDIGEGVADALEAAVAGRGVAGKPVGIERDHLPAMCLAAIEAEIGDPHDIGALLWAQRRIKDEAEIAQIEANVAGNDRMFETVRRTLRPGVTEVELWAAIFGTLCELSGGASVLEGDLGGGLRTTNPDAKPTLERLVQGDGVLIDLYPGTAGYFADTTRNFVLGEPSDKQLAVHRVLEEALGAGEGALRPGARGCEVDAVVRTVIERAGYGPNFPHHCGHAYGLFQQERPFLIPAEKKVLETGMIVTLEPGIYIEGWGGMRLEGNYVIGEAGPRRLDHFPSQLTVC